ncbi:hypothetical protein TNCV_3703021 [Trichonephila clavipes]|nr:hypothetical protein TNCV_3703021 [Trichonephila clavipes]
MNKATNLHLSPSLIFIIIVRTTNKAKAGSLCLLALAVALRFPPTLSLRPLLATLLRRSQGFCNIQLSCNVLPRFPQVALRVGIGLSSSKIAAADFQNSVVITDEPLCCCNLAKIILRKRFVE